jgi:hypothetical protein
VTVRKTKDGPKVTNGNWRLMVDETTGLKFSQFYDKQSDMVEPTCEHFNRWAQHGKPVKFVRLDNAGENKSMQSGTQTND